MSAAVSVLGLSRTFVDSELVAKVIVEDDREAFEALVKKYQSPIRAFFRKMNGGDEALADDLAQETFLKAYRGLKYFNGQSQFITWLYAIAKNVFFEHARSKVKHEELEESDMEGYNTHQDRSMDLAKCMLTLEPEERMILTLSYSEGLVQTEVAELMNIPLGTVKTIALRAKEKLKTQLLVYQERSV